MTLSSEGSVSTSTSRIRQFGLYRSIDARTEEFLRLSRKRQIKQGCACAAISTTITVTVVIAVSLVYMEYEVDTKLSQRPLENFAWNRLVNDSIVSNLEDKFGKHRANLDKETIKLLPILIKALKRIFYIENILEDSSSSNSAENDKVTTEYYFKKDVNKIKNWLKRPTSKLYAIEYKTPPKVFVKNPSRNTDFYSKARKVKDQKRMMEYFGKMIQDKVKVHVNNPLFNTEPEIQIEKHIQEIQDISDKLKNISPHVSFKEFNNTNEKNDIKPTKKDRIVNCHCPKHLNFLLKKILSSIQQLLPNSLSYKSHIMCSSKNEKSDIMETSNTQIKTTTVKNNRTTTKNLSLPLIIDTKLVNFSEFDKTTREVETGQAFTNAYTLNEDETTTGIYQIEATETKSTIVVTEPMIPVTSTMSINNNKQTGTKQYVHVEKNSESTDTDKLRIANIIERPKTQSSILLHSEKDDESDVDSAVPSSTTVNVIEHLNNNSFYGIQLLKTNQLIPHSRHKPNQIQTTFGSISLEKQDSVTQKQTNLDLVKPKWNSMEIATSYADILPFFDYSKLYPDLRRNASQNPIPVEDPKKTQRYDGYKNVVEEDEIEKLTSYENDLQQEDFYRDSRASIAAKNRTANHIQNQDKNSLRPVNSMIPQNRPTYLEIRRNNWNSKDTIDVDANV